MFLVATMKISILFISFLVALCKGHHRIAGGEPATIEEFPYAAALLTNGGSGTAFRHACGGTVISKNALLSAASCFRTGTSVHAVSWWRARVGSSFSHSAGTIHIVSRITEHPNFNQETFEHNIAVLRTRFDISLVPGRVEQAFLPGAVYATTANQRMRAIGWGANQAGQWSEQLQRAEIFIVDQGICTSRYAGYGVAVTSNMVCAGWLDVGVRGQCDGDVGGPLLDEGTVVGVFSHTDTCADDFLPALNTRVQVYTQWIVEMAIAD